MDLWIKSQDKKLLIKVNHIMRINNRIFAGDTLGEYDSEERAIEILDEIQKLLMGQDKLVISGVLDFEDAQQIKKKLDQTGVVSVFSKDDIGYISPITIVYEMPLE